MGELGMVARHNLLVGLAALATALLSGCGRPVLPAAAPTVFPPPPPVPVSIPTVSPPAGTPKGTAPSQAENRLRVWEAQLQQQQAELNRHQQEIDLAARRARQPVLVAPAPTPQFTSQPWQRESQPLRDTAPLPPAIAAIPSAAPGYRPPTPPVAAYGNSAPPQPTAPPTSEPDPTPYAAPRPERPRRVGIYGPGWPSAEPVYVRGYTRADGSYVRPHYRTYRTPR